MSLPQLTEEWSAVSIKELALIIGMARWGPRRQLGFVEGEASSAKVTSQIGICVYIEPEHYHS